MSRILREIADAVEAGEVDDARELAQEALDDGESPQDIINGGLLAGMEVVGKYFKNGEMFVPEVLQSAQALDAGMQVVKPLLAQGDVTNKGKVVFCTVNGDLHDIGKKLCIMLLEGSGYEVVDIGINVPTADVVAGVKEHQPDILAMSAMLTTTMGAMDDVAKALKDAGLDESVKVMIGGAPLNQDYADRFAAYYSDDAVSCVNLADSLMSA
ncbi:MAG: corrinoid protein [Clostridiales Family XIII bacterium]|jgi:5-methyltetrahydrofolate--homocysteine methyltransferase|nr:corrinoid protein [Clostridiales Family XIII bacterium]